MASSQHSAQHFTSGFVGHRAPGVADHADSVLASLHKAAATIIDRAKSQEGDRLLKEATDKARELGIFGAPTFAVWQEVFWGDDRLEEAIGFDRRIESARPRHGPPMPRPR